MTIKERFVGSFLHKKKGVRGHFHNTKKGFVRSFLQHVPVNITRVSVIMFTIKKMVCGIIFTVRIVQRKGLWAHFYVKKGGCGVSTYV